MLLRWQKNSLYFTVSVYRDLVGDWILTQSWGDSRSEESEFSHTVMPSLAEAEKHVTKIRLGLIRNGFREQPERHP